MTQRESKIEAGTIESVYRAHSARILAALVRVFGPENLELAEDVLQDAFRKALGVWEAEGVPDNPAAWLLTTAKRGAIDVVRSQRTQRKFASDLAFQLESGWTLAHTVEQQFDESQIKDHQLRMIFMCCNADVAAENRIPLVLRTLSGFSIPAIARALLISEPTVKKRLVRTRERLQGYSFEFPTADKLPLVMDAVHTVLYLLFNEGFHSSDAARPMNLELCREAIHLTSLLVAEPRIVSRDTLGLLALMQFHLARVSARLDAEGNPVPLDLQDREAWDQQAIGEARLILELASAAPPSSTDRYFIEAKIAEQHCIASGFEHTDWGAILGWYDALVRVTGSPLAELNRAVAAGYAGELDTAIASAKQLGSNDALAGSHLPLAVLAHLAALKGDATGARRQAQDSARLGGTPHEQRLLFEQVERLLARHSTAR